MGVNAVGGVDGGGGNPWWCREAQAEGWGSTALAGSRCSASAMVSNGGGDVGGYRGAARCSPGPTASAVSREGALAVDQENDGGERIGEEGLWVGCGTAACGEEGPSMGFFRGWGWAGSGVFAAE